MKNRPRKPKGISMSSVREVMRLVRQGERAVLRSFVAVDRRVITEGGIIRE